jgi:predicted O-linked N-acetylglucosamine transferase (SPINDLY family)
LIRLQSLPTCYRRPEIDPARAQRERFGLPADATLYLCLQTLFKFHPSFDATLGAILRDDPGGLLLLIEGPRKSWQTLLMERLRRSIPDVAGRIRVLPAQGNEDYLALTALADVVLDPPVFGGGNTTLEALAAGRPVVTLPGRFLRSRITQGFLRHVGLDAFVAADITEYARLAIATARLARTGDLPPIAERAASLFGQRATIPEHERFFEKAREAARAGRSVAAWPE